METTRIYLLRHGEVEGHEAKRYNGQANVRLTPRGEAQFGLLQARLAKKPLAAIYSSDLQRCRFGADQFGQERSLVPVTLTALRELHIGHWEGMTWQDIERQYPDEWQSRLQDLVHYQVPEGESLQQLAERVLPVLQNIVAKHLGEEIVVVAHGGVNRVVLLDAIGAPLSRLFSIEQDYGCLNIIDYYADGQAVVRLLNG
ncbi:MAG TPA: alpha-ribazole phosphatase [Geothermobacteraceae bacterium]|nr:alpha-ribazole phosphatase [Geothermobacteraceae bacterium]